MQKKLEKEASEEHKAHCYVSKSSAGKTFTSRVQAENELSMTRKMLIAALRYQNQREVEMLQESMQRQLRKCVEVQKMPSVRVRPTLRVEMKHRVMNCKL